MENIDFLPPIAPNLVLERETYMAYYRLMITTYMLKFYCQQSYV